MVATAADRVILDASILVDFSLGRPEALEFVSASPGSRLVAHPVSIAELLVGARNKRELQHLWQLASRFKRVHVAPADFDHCLAFVHRHTLKHGTDWADCLLAATALRTRMVVATLNEKHFRAIAGLKILRPY